MHHAISWKIFILQAKPLLKCYRHMVHLHSCGKEHVKHKNISHIHFNTIYFYIYFSISEMGWIRLRQTLATWPYLTSRSCLHQSHKNPEFNLFPWRPFCASNLPLPWHVLPYFVYKSAFCSNGILYKTACNSWWYCGMYWCVYVCFVCQLIGCLLGVRVCVCVCVWV